MDLQPIKYGVITGLAPNVIDLPLTTHLRHHRRTSEICEDVYNAQELQSYAYFFSSN